MRNKDVIEILKRAYSEKAPDILHNLDFAKVESEEVKIVPIKRHYYKAAAVYAAACLVVICALPFIIGGDKDPEKPIPASGSGKGNDRYGT